MDSNHRSRKTADLQSAPFGHSGIRPKIIEPMEGGIRTHDPEITNHVLWPTELHRQIAPINVTVNPMRNGCKFSDKF